MKIINRSTLLGTSLLLSASLSFAGCPQVGGYTETSHHGGHFRHCNYISTNPVIGGAHTRNACKGFILTDPHYKLVRCKFDRHTSKCMCHIVRK